MPDDKMNPRNDKAQPVKVEPAEEEEKRQPSFAAKGAPANREEPEAEERE